MRLLKIGYFINGHDKFSNAETHCTKHVNSYGNLSQTQCCTFSDVGMMYRYFHMYYVLIDELLDLIKSDVTILCKTFFDVTYFHNVFFNDQNFKYSMPNIPNNLTKCTLIF